MKSLRFFVLLVLSSSYVFGQNPSCPFDKGFNLAQWFQKGSASEIRNSYTISDLENMIALGADHVRLPIDLYSMSGNASDYTLDPILFLNLDRVVDWAEELGLHIILDNHITTSEHKNNTAKLIAIWQQMANHFKNRSKNVLYEIRNEPYGIDDTDWGEMQDQVIKSIRAIDKIHTIVVSPTDLGSYYKLAQLPHYEDNNLIYTFHFYDPFLFTHQGSNWTSPSMENLVGVPYPYDAAKMPAMPTSFQGTWLEDQYGWYDDDGNKASCQSKANIGIQFRTDRQVPVYCGEFGALQANSSEKDRLNWTLDIADIFKTGNVAWTMWGYGGAFGIFKEGSRARFPEDLDTPIIEALGLNRPNITEILPDTSEFIFYEDLSHPQTVDLYGNGPFPNHYHTDAVQGDYCIQWTGAGQYNTFGWKFTTPKDFSNLTDKDYVLKFWMKSTSSDLRIEIRFEDTDLANGEDHPWRMAKTIENNLVPMDGEWHEVEIKLKDMLDAGSWHNNAWYPSEGKFDWSRIDILQFSTEDHPFGNNEIYIDHLRIVETGVNTVVDLENSFSNETIKLDQAFPNPFSYSTTIRFGLAETEDLTIRIYNVAGKLIRTLHSGPLGAGYHNLTWDATNEKGDAATSGMYIYELTTTEKVIQKKMLLLR